MGRSWGISSLQLRLRAYPDSLYFLLLLPNLFSFEPHVVYLDTGIYLIPFVIGLKSIPCTLYST